MTTDHREPARITRARFGVEPDRGLHVAELYLEGRDGGWGQGFQMCLSAELVPHAELEICQTFGVTTGAQLTGLDCFALYSFGKYSGPICGIESTGGRRFTRAGFAKRNGLRFAGELEERINSIERGIQHCQQQIKEQRQSLLTIRGKFVDWETMP